MPWRLPTADHTRKFSTLTSPRYGIAKFHSREREEVMVEYWRRPSSLIKPGKSLRYWLAMTDLDGHISLIGSAVLGSIILRATSVVMRSLGEYDS